MNYLVAILFCVVFYLPAMDQANSTHDLDRSGSIFEWEFPSGRIMGDRGPTAAQILSFMPRSMSAPRLTAREEDDSSSTQALHGDSSQDSSRVSDSSSTVSFETGLQRSPEPELDPDAEFTVRGRSLLMRFQARMHQDVADGELDLRQRVIRSLAVYSFTDVSLLGQLQDILSQNDAAAFREIYRRQSAHNQQGMLDVLEDYSASYRRQAELFARFLLGFIGVQDRFVSSCLDEFIDEDVEN